MSIARWLIGKLQVFVGWWWLANILEWMPDGKIQTFSNTHIWGKHAIVAWRQMCVKPKGQHDNNLAQIPAAAVTKGGKSTNGCKGSPFVQGFQVSGRKNMFCLHWNIIRICSETYCIFQSSSMVCSTTVTTQGAPNLSPSLLNRH